MRDAKIVGPRALLALLLASLAVGIAPAEAPLPAAGRRAPEYLVLVSVDACRPEYLDLARLPNFEGLKAAGSFFPEAWVGALESNTPPGHAEMATGCLPARNGILGFGWRDPATGKMTRPTSLEAISRGELESVAERSGVPTLSGLVKSRWPEAKVAVVTTHKYYAAQGLGLGPSDYIIYAEAERDDRVRGRGPGIERTGASSLFPRALPGKEPDADFLADPALRGSAARPGDDMRYVFRLASAVASRYRPRALLVNAPETDGQGHKTGGLSDPDSMREVMRGFDEGLGALVEAYRAAGLMDRTLWVITADHGMTAEEREIDPRPLRAAIKAAGTAGAGFPYLYLRDPSKAEAVARGIAAAAPEGLTGVYWLERGVDGSFAYRAAEGGLRPGAALDAAYRVLLAGFAGPSAPDLVLASAEGWGFGRAAAPAAAKGAKAARAAKGERQGSHGMVNWADQHVFLLLSGPGVAAGLSSPAPARLVDILPTLALAMGLPAPACDGTALAREVPAAGGAALAARAKVDAALSAPRDALRDSARR